MDLVRRLNCSFSFAQSFVFNQHLDGMYGNFAGRDASRGMAKQSFDLGTKSLEPFIAQLNCLHRDRNVDAN